MTINGSARTGVQALRLLAGHMRSQLAWCFSALIVLHLVVGCGGEESPIASNPSQAAPLLFEKPMIFVRDAGRISVDHGPVELRHRFELENTTSSELRIETVRKTCGCVASHAESDVLPAGGKIGIIVALTVKDTGQISHGATVILSDGSVATYKLAANGTINADLRVILTEPYFEPSRKRIPVRLCLVNSHGAPTSILPTLETSEIDLSFDGWETLEERDADGLRPSRQIGNGTLDFSRFSGTFPVEVTVRLDQIASRKVVVFGPDPLVSP